MRIKAAHRTVQPVFGGTGSLRLDPTRSRRQA